MDKEKQVEMLREAISLGRNLAIAQGMGIRVVKNAISFGKKPTSDVIRTLEESVIASKDQIVFWEKHQAELDPDLTDLVTQQDRDQIAELIKSFKEQLQSLEEILQDRNN